MRIRMSGLVSEMQISLICTLAIKEELLRDLSGAKNLHVIASPPSARFPGSRPRRGCARPGSH